MKFLMIEYDLYQMLHLQRAGCKMSALKGATKGWLSCMKFSSRIAWGWAEIKMKN